MPPASQQMGLEAVALLQPLAWEMLPASQQMGLEAVALLQPLAWEMLPASQQMVLEAVALLQPLAWEMLPASQQTGLEAVVLRALAQTLVCQGPVSGAQSDLLEDDQPMGSSDRLLANLELSW
jgi:hypothetical protein